MRNFFLNLKFLGVTSKSSSSLIYAIICSKDIFRGGIRLTASSVPDALTFVNCFPFSTFISKSFSITAVIKSVVGSSTLEFTVF